MTLKTSFNPTGVLKHSFIMAAKASILPAMLSFIALLLTMVVTNRFFYGPFPLVGSSHRSNYSFVLNDPGLSPVVVGIIITSAVFSAIMTFIFMYKKNAVDVYFSIGLTRKNLFLTRYLAGVLMSTMPILLVMIIAYIANIMILGASSALTAAFMHLLPGFVVLNVLIFTITCLLCTLCGTVAESILLSACGLGGISLLTLGINFLVKIFLFGNPYGIFSNSYQTVRPNLLRVTAAFNPLLFFLQDAKNYSYLFIDNVVSPLASASPEINGSHIWVWLLVSILLSLVALKLFQRRKVEIAGTAGTNRVATFICTLILTFFFFALTVSLANPFLNRLSALLVATIVGIVVYVVSALVFKHYPFRANVLKLPLSLGICFLCIVILAGGGFGFTSRLPAQDDIESVYISYKGSPDYQLELASSGTSHDGSSASYNFTVHNLAYTQSSDIQRILDIHQAIIDYGDQPLSRATTVTDPADYTIKSEIAVIYTLKDGGEFIRYYTATSLDNLMRILALDDTDYMKARLEQALQANKIDSVFTYGDIHLTDIFYSQQFHYTDARSRLLAALSADLSEQTLQQRYFQNQAAMGVLVFGGAGDYDDRYFGGAYGIFAPGVPKIFITEDFTQTISFLQEENLLEHFAFKGEIDYVTVKRYLINPQPVLYYKSHYFRSYNSDFDANTAAVRITKQAEQNELISRSRTNYFAAAGGYIIGVYIKDHGPTFMFLPQKDAPDFITNL